VIGNGHLDWRPTGLPPPSNLRITPEAASEYGGYLEGALAAAEAASVRMRADRLHLPVRPRG